MMTRSERGPGRGHVLLAVGVVAALAGCASSAAPIATTHTLVSELASTATSTEDDQAWAGVLDQFPDAIRPDVTVVRTVLPDAWNNAVADCLADQGFAATVTPDGGVQSGVLSPPQEESYAVALYSCQVSYPVDPVHLGAHQLAYLHE